MTTFLTVRRIAAGTILALSAGAACAVESVAVPPAAPHTANVRVAAIDPVATRNVEGREIVAMPGDYAAGTIVVMNAERRLYLAIGDGKAIVYPVAIGKPGRALHGTVSVVRKVANPSWTPTPNIRKENPNVPAFVPAGPNNPLGPRALYLSKGFYRIHGTNKPSSIGQAASNGCIRMHNKDVLDLFARVSVGATVHVIQ